MTYFVFCYFLLKYNWFTMSYSFLVYISEVIQLCEYTYSLTLWLITGYWIQLPVLCVCVCCCRVAQWCLTLWDHTHARPPCPSPSARFAQVHVHCIGDVLLLLSHFSLVRLCVTPQTAARQAPLSLGFSRQEYWGELPFPSPGDLPGSGLQPASPILATGLYHCATWEAPIYMCVYI